MTNEQRTAKRKAAERLLVKEFADARQAVALLILTIRDNPDVFKNSGYWNESKDAAAQAGYQLIIAENLGGE